MELPRSRRTSKFDESGRRKRKEVEVVRCRVLLFARLGDPKEVDAPCGAFFVARRSFCVLSCRVNVILVLMKPVASGLGLYCGEGEEKCFILTSWSRHMDMICQHANNRRTGADFLPSLMGSRSWCLGSPRAGGGVVVKRMVFRDLFVFLFRCVVFPLWSSAFALLCWSWVSMFRVGTTLADVAGLRSRYHHGRFTEEDLAPYWIRAVIPKQDNVSVCSLSCFAQ